MSDLFQDGIPSGNAETYTADTIEVLEGLEPVRKRPGMYIGGTDERAFHHMAAEIVDNAMDEAVAGHATGIWLDLRADGSVSVRDNGRGIPVDPHPKFPDRSALEIILTTLHSGGKFGSGAYKVSGGLHGVGLSVVNALSARLTVEVAREKTLWTQSFERGIPVTTLERVGAVSNRRGTTVTFVPDPQIFGEGLQFKPGTLYRMVRSKAYLFRGVKIHWSCAPELLRGIDNVPEREDIHFPNGLEDFLRATLKDQPLVGDRLFAGRTALADNRGSVEWALCWPEDSDGFLSSYVNTIPTVDGGTHEAGLRGALTKGLKAYGEMAGQKKRADTLTPEDVIGGAAIMLSVFITEPQFQSQTKGRLVNADATRLVEQAVRDSFDHWLSGAPDMANAILGQAFERAEDRLRRRQAKETSRKSATKRLRLPGKLADCTRSSREGTELFLVEGDSAGGSAKQARNRETQAVLPLRGKILNVASASVDKMVANQELSDLVEALGCGTGRSFERERLRYDRVIIMTDADVDGAHIASLLMTFFFREMPELVAAGHLYLAQPPLYRLTQGAKSVYARDDAHRDELLKTVFKGKGKVDISRFKGLGEMPMIQLRETTMSPATRQLLRVTVPTGRTEEDHEEAKVTARLVEDLMGRKPEKRFQFIQENARFIEVLDI
ncbi:DNA topoisomerase IV subunit B [Phaeovibrio sulfidiphilus]|uniref:DNA topoisomerase 4 subunit B n=1 Tax=Phaeovibrio sulfidiphilus TaxID=1220600 RepID=A0A8J7CVH6_9PROT|nr:DNA topoisomerase IV subunit B [Phaeovibrio sulfidiphilus]MBE1236316.1 DNA topoisomerase IV subunit B [Phaeovibrio sulfidiphilus]